MYSCLVIIPKSSKELVLSLKTSHKNNQKSLRPQRQSWKNRALCQGKRKTLSHPWLTSNLWSFGSSFCKRMILETLKWCEMAIVSSWSSHVFFVGGPCKEMTHVAGCCDPQLKKTRICFWFLYLYNIIYIYILRLDIYIYECRWYYINSHNMP